jgi:hypothetical protein
MGADQGSISLVIPCFITPVHCSLKVRILFFPISGHWVEEDLVPVNYGNRWQLPKGTDLRATKAWCRGRWYVM